MTVVTYAYNGSDTAVATIVAPIIGHEYIFLAANGTPVTGTAVASPLSLTINDIVSGSFGNIPFAVSVADNTSPNNQVACGVFHKNDTAPYVFAATWDYDAPTQTVTVTFDSVAGVDYLLWISDWGPGYADYAFVGNGSMMSVSVTDAGTLAGDFIAFLVTPVAGVDTCYTNRFFSLGVSGAGAPGNPVPDRAGVCERVWRFAVTDLQGETLTILDHLASERTVTPMLNEPLQVTGTVPSDSPEVNMLHTDNLPFLAEGVRQLYCFRRESNVTPYYTIRASTLIMQVGDASRSDDARSRFTAWDPWQYLFSRPVLQSSLAVVVNPQDVPTPGVDGQLIPAQRLLYPSTMRADEIILDILVTTAAFADITAPAAAIEMFIDYNNTGFYTGTIEQCAKFSTGFPIQQGTSVGQALKDMCDTGYVDIVLEPIYDPANRPGILCQLSIYAQSVVNGEITKLGAGSYNYAAQFAWDRPGRSLVGFDDLFDGTGRANHIQYYTGSGGPSITAANDAASIAKYGEYWAQSQSFFPAVSAAEIDSVKAIARMQLALRKTFKQTLTVNPAPERSPDPFVDYYLGDGVPVFIGRPQQDDPSTAPVVGVYRLGDSRSRQTLPPGYTGVPPSPNPLMLVWQRVYGIPIDIDDNGVETVRELIVGPVGAPPPPAGAGGQQAPQTNQQVAITTARQTNRQGGVGP